MNIPLTTGTNIFHLKKTLSPYCQLKKKGYFGNFIKGKVSKF